MKNLKKIFSVTNQQSKNNKWYKVIYILGIKFSIRNKRKEKRIALQKEKDTISSELKKLKKQNKELVNTLTEQKTEFQRQNKELVTALSEQKLELQKQNDELTIKLDCENKHLIERCSKLEAQNQQLKNELKCNYEKNTQKITRITKQPTLKSIAYHVVDHCNLKCRSCDHFSPLAEQKFSDISSFESDIKRFSEISNGELQILKLMGGEPLLHPDLNEFMRTSRQYLPNTRIEIVTNAILLNSQKEEFWISCKENDIVIVPTKYPLKTNYENLEKIAEKYNVKYEYYGNSNEVLKTSYHTPLDLEGKQNPICNFLNCFHANNCVFLKNGKLYTCTVAPNIEHFNKYFNKDIPLTDKDGIDIYKAKSIDEILDFLAKPIPFCKYCNVNGRTFGHEWGISKKQIEEWT